MKIIAGLGNPGKEYHDTRHNIGFMVIDELLKECNLKCNKNKFNGSYCLKIINDEQVLFLKPQKYINLSGEVIKKYVDYYKVEVNDILIIHDDLDISLGKYKLKPSGSSAGHNGLKNIELNLGTEEYKRLKIGISNNKSIDTKDYVLSKFNEEEKEEINKVIEVSKDIIKDYLKISFDDLMNKYNKKIDI